MSTDEADLTKRLEEEGDIAADYLEELLDIVDLGGEFEIDVERDRATVEIVDEEDERELRRLVGRDGSVLDALQELTRLAVQNKTGERSRLMLDVAGHRKAQRARLAAIAEEGVTRVQVTGEPVRLEPMNPFERKVCHDVVAAAGLYSDSEGTPPHRRVVIFLEPPVDNEASEDLED
ncbi:single-stranded DNA-binding protein [Actinomycetaceae bacterium TAE3-ERU4]|nr:single-stranded DNA-binding protein [Actinomycetaceae bacterium TAE3-ERU4]